MTIGCILFGPSKIFQIPYPDNDYESSLNEYKKLLLIFGNIFIGLPAGFYAVSVLVELISAIKDYFGALPGTNEKGSALFTMFAAMGIILSNILGGILFEFFGNRITCDIFCLASLSMAIIVFLFNIKPGYIISKSKQETIVPHNENTPPQSKK